MFHYGKSGDTNFFAHLSSLLLLSTPSLLHPTSRGGEQSMTNWNKWEGRKGGAGTMPACCSSAGLRRRITAKRRGGRREESSEKGEQGSEEEGAVRWWERQIIYPTTIIISPPAVLSAHYFILCLLSPLRVMSGSNWWILLTFPALHFSVNLRVWVCVCALQVPFSGYVHYDIPSHSMELRKHS